MLLCSILNCDLLLLMWEVCEFRRGRRFFIMDNKPMNVLLITTDQQHFSTLGSVNSKIKTPALDRLVKEGTRYDRAYCTNPVCSPSRSTIITGMYASLHGCWTIGVKLPEDVDTVGDVFQANGYATNLIGKAHFQPLASIKGSESIECFPTLRDLDFWRGFHGPWYGFEHVETCRNHGDEALVGGHYAVWMEDQGFMEWQDYYRKWPNESSKQVLGKWELPEKYHYTHWTGERTIAAIEKNVAEGRNFFTWSSFHDPHPPCLVPEPWASMYDPDDMEPGELAEGELELMSEMHQLTQEEKPDFSNWEESGHPNHGYRSHLANRREMQEMMTIYYGMMSFIDHEVGLILDKLDELGIADNTLVVFTTDHGHFLGQHGLNQKGAFHYEDLIRLPFIVKCPGQLERGGASNSLQSLVDLAPTFLELCGIEVPGVMQGVSQLGTWRGENEGSRNIAIVENRHQPSKVHLRTYVGERYKITFFRDEKFGELFDLKDDPGEKCNSWDDKDYADVKAEMMCCAINEEIVREHTRMPRIAHA